MKDISGLLRNAKKYKISEEVLRSIAKRDSVCVYCHRKMRAHLSTIGTPDDKATIEHFSDIGEYNADETEVGICCGACNRMKRDKKLSEWFKTLYCLNREPKINEKTVAKPVKEYLKKIGKKS